MTRAKKCYFLWWLANEKNGMCLTRNASGDLAVYEICGGHREERQLLRPLWRFLLDRYQFSLGDTQDVLAPLSLF